ncbi:Mur ligase family protein [Desulfofalx alkaliphila]|uniref:Mur ligase family protein n=1 Tax=Desulfofalx alkaliphila TaxID=105483 RepID=UPI0004E25135|nr:Mur ligase family protein [Desulfofalx alkaliphila]
MRLCLSTAVIGGKLSSLLSRLAGGQGSSLPGLVARRIYPHTLRDLASQVKKGIIMVTGTNGKTTTNNMIAKVMQAGGHQVIINEEGANMITGVTACFIRSASCTGTIEYDYALLEVDEASFPKVVNEVKPQVVVVTNFFRDQLDRYGELDTTVGLVTDTLKKIKDVTLVLNADDPLVAQMGKSTGHNAIYFGIAKEQEDSGTGGQNKEARFCAFCNNILNYSYYHYSQLGDYSCENCGFRRPQAHVEAIVSKLEAGAGALTTEICYENRCANISLYTTGFYNLYNALAAFTVGLVMQIEEHEIQRGLERYTPAVGRMERFRYMDKQVLLNLVKNPTGFNEGLVTMLSLPGKKNIFMAVNDNDADGRDVSWLWEVDFEMLISEIESINSFFCSGIRAEEMALRLKYADVPADKITVIKDLKQAISCSLQGEVENTYLFTTYTALWPTQKVLCSLADKEESDAHRMPSVS